MTKEHILQEVRRTAEANGGVCLGKEKFFQETGIREADWKGKFWVRWSEVVREAGFEPNQMTTALDETLLIEKFIVLARELKRFPVVAEIRMKKRSDATSRTIRPTAHDLGQHSNWPAGFTAIATTARGTKIFPNCVQLIYPRTETMSLRMK